MILIFALAPVIGFGIALIWLSAKFRKEQRGSNARIKLLEDQEAARKVWKRI
jgi:hypothetical protein